MRRPQPKQMQTDRQRLAAQFAFIHFALSVQFGHDASYDFRVQAARREYVRSIVHDRFARWHDGMNLAHRTLV